MSGDTCSEGRCVLGSAGQRLRGPQFLRYDKAPDAKLVDLQPPDPGAPDAQATDGKCTDGQRANRNGAERKPSYRYYAAGERAKGAGGCCRRGLADSGRTMPHAFHFAVG